MPTNNFAGDNLTALVELFEYCRNCIPVADTTQMRLAPEERSLHEALGSIYELLQKQDALDAPKRMWGGADVSEKPEDSLNLGPDDREPRFKVWLCLEELHDSGNYEDRDLPFAATFETNDENEAQTFAERLNAIGRILSGED